MTTISATLVDLMMNVFAVLANIVCLPYSLWCLLKAALFSQNKVLKPRVVAITGANSGIGEGLAYSYAKDKCALVLLARNKDRLKKAAEECERLGAIDVKVVQMDVADTKNVATFFEEKVIEYDIDLFIANAGVAAISEMSILDQAEQVLQINTLGAIAGMNAVYKAFEKRGRGGQIACVSSIFAYLNPPYVLSYGASKAAVMSYSRDLRALGKDVGITVNTIAPGYIQTAMTSSFNAKSSLLYLTPEYFAEKVKYGLAHDVPLISFPLYQFFIFGVLSVLPPAVKQAISISLHKYIDKYISGNKKKMPEAAVANAAAKKQE